MNDCAESWSMTPDRLAEIREWTELDAETLLHIEPSVWLDALRDLLRDRDALAERVTDWMKVAESQRETAAKLLGDRDALAAEVERLREALEWIKGASDGRPVCLCGRPTGTGAIVSHAERALAPSPSGGQP